MVLLVLVLKYIVFWPTLSQCSLCCNCCCFVTLFSIVSLIFYFCCCFLAGKLYTAGGISSILKELSDDIVPAEGEEIYNPFTPVCSPSEETPARIDKIFLQTSSGYRPVEHCYYKHSFVGASSSSAGNRIGGGRVGGHAEHGAGGGSSTSLRPSASFGDTRCLLEGGSCQR